MSDRQRKHMRALFWAIEINAILWMAALGSVIAPNGPAQPAWVMPAIGLGFAAIVQHWAYYRMYRPARGEGE